MYLQHTHSVVFSKSINRRSYFRVPPAKEVMYQSPTKILKINIRRFFCSGSVHRTLIVELAHCVCVGCRCGGGGGGQCIQIMYSERERKSQRKSRRRKVAPPKQLCCAQRTFNMFKVPLAVSRVGTGFMYLFVKVLNTRRPLLYRSVHGLMVIHSSLTM